MTVWLIRIRPETRRRDVRYDLADANRMHRRVMSLAPDSLGDHARHQAGILYRIEETRADLRILVQTTIAPEADRLPAGYGTVELRDITPLLDTLQTGQSIAYRLAANTTKRLSRSAGADNGKIKPLSGDEIDAWWTARASRAGLHLASLRSYRDAPATGRQQTEPDMAAETGDRRHRRIRHAITVFDGTATVTDPDALRTAIIAGIGRGKSYGCGLLSIAPIRLRP